MSSRQKRTGQNNVYIYRPFDPDQEEVKKYRDRWIATMINHHGFDIGTKKRPKGTPEERSRIVAHARVVLEALGLLPDYFEPGPEEETDTTRADSPKCNHMVCTRCQRCYCDGKLRVQEDFCAECRWVLEGHASGPTATVAAKDLTAHD